MKKASDSEVGLGAGESEYDKMVKGCQGGCGLDGRKRTLWDLHYVGEVKPFDSFLMARGWYKGDCSPVNDHLICRLHPPDRRHSTVSRE